MPRVIKLNEVDLTKIVEKVLREQTASINSKNLKLGDGGLKHPEQVNDVKELQQKLINAKLLKIYDKNGKESGPTGYFGEKTNIALQQYNKIQNKNVKQTYTGVPKICPSISDSTNINFYKEDFDFWKKKYPTVNTQQLIDRIVNRNAKIYMDNGIRQRSACQAAFTSTRPQFNSKYLFIVDTNEKLVYLFDKQKNQNYTRSLIAKDFIISGKQKQSEDAIKIAQNLKLSREKIKNGGYEESGPGKWTNKKYPGKMFSTFEVLTKENFRWLPAGTYNIQNVGDVGGNYSEQGKGGNIAGLRTLDDNALSQALHSVYLGDNRMEAVRQAQQLLKNPKNPEEVNKFVNILKKGGVNLNWSYGCINFPARFMDYFRKYASGAILVNLSESEGNYLAKNTENYIEKMTKTESCPSPNSIKSQDLFV